MSSDFVKYSCNQISSGDTSNAIELSALFQINALIKSANFNPKGLIQSSLPIPDECHPGVSLAE
jgi:hypothetical protein